MQFGSNAKRTVQDYLLRVCAAAVITLLLATALGLCLAALYLYLINVLAPPFAALITAGGTLILCGLVVLFVWLANNYYRARADSVQKTRKTGDRGGDALNSVLVELATDWIASNAKKASFAGLLGGILTGASPELRQMLIRALRGSTSSK